MQDVPEGKKQKNTCDRDVHEKVCAAIDAHMWGALWATDQLRAAQLANAAFPGFQESPPNFYPTFKVKRVGSKVLTPGDMPLPVYSKQRAPAWCDRVLWRTGPRLDGDRELKQVSIAPAELVSSDHRPLSSAFVMPIDVLNAGMSPAFGQATAKFAFKVACCFESAKVEQLHCKLQSRLFRGEVATDERKAARGEAGDDARPVNTPAHEARETAMWECVECKLVRNCPSFVRHQPVYLTVSGHDKRSRGQGRIRINATSVAIDSDRKCSGAGTCQLYLNGLVSGEVEYSYTLEWNHPASLEDCKEEKRDSLSLFRSPRATSARTQSKPPLLFDGCVQAFREDRCVSAVARDGGAMSTLLDGSQHSPGNDDWFYQVASEPAGEKSDSDEDEEVQEVKSPTQPAKPSLATFKC